MPLRKQICFTIVWGCAEILPSPIVFGRKKDKRFGMWSDTQIVSDMGMPCHLGLRCSWWIQGYFLNAMMNSSWSVPNSATTVIRSTLTERGSPPRFKTKPSADWCRLIIQRLFHTSEISVTFPTRETILLLSVSQIDWLNCLHAKQLTCDNAWLIALPIPRYFTTNTPFSSLTTMSNAWIIFDSLF